MATKEKTYNYVLVLTHEGPKFVTSIGEGKTAHWDKLEAPKEMPLDFARDMALGLTWNGHVAFAVSSRFALDTQPYLYSKGHFEWKYDEETEDEK